MENTKIGALLGANGMAAAVSPMVNEVMSLLVMFGQVAVAGVTVWYIVKKIRAMKKNNEPKEKPDEEDGN